jgi:hypothetical protein
MLMPILENISILITLLKENKIEWTYLHAFINFVISPREYSHWSTKTINDWEYTGI